jgi:voltage-dependent potassium channel beta subunit
MQYRQLGRSGLKISEIGLGSWLTYGHREVPDDQARACVRKAMDLGINFIDTADVYASGAAETFLGQELKQFCRSSIVLATKCHGRMGDGPNDRGGSRKHVMEACEASLQRLQTDYLDLYQCHMYDSETPVEETVRAMDDLIRQGKVLYWGVSNYSAAQLREALMACEAGRLYRPISHQPRYNMLQRDDIEKELIHVCGQEGLGLVVYCPLAQGVLTGKYSGGKRPKGSRGARRGPVGSLDRLLAPQTLKKVDALQPIAKRLRLSLAQLALAWCLRQWQLGCVIIGATRPEQIEENCGAAGIKLDATALERIEAVLTGQKQPKR